MYIDGWNGKKLWGIVKFGQIWLDGGEVALGVFVPRGALGLVLCAIDHLTICEVRWATLGSWLDVICL